MLGYSGYQQAWCWCVLGSADTAFHRGLKNTDMAISRGGTTIAGQCFLNTEMAGSRGLMNTVSASSNGLVNVWIRVCSWVKNT